MPYSDPEEAKRKKRAWYLANKERIAEKSASEYKKNPEKFREKSTRNYRENKAEIRKRRDEINKENPDQKKKWNARYREKNRAKINKWVTENREIVNEWKKRHYKRHGEKVKAYNRRKNEGWENAPQRMELWEINDDAMLFNCPLSDKQLAKELGRSVMAVSTRRANLKAEYGEFFIEPNDQAHSLQVKESRKNEHERSNV